MAALTFDDSIMDRILANYDVFPAGYDELVDGPPPRGYAINPTVFSTSLRAVASGRVSVANWKALFNATGTGASDLDWLVSEYTDNNNPARTDAEREAWLDNVENIFQTIALDASVGSGEDGYRSRGSLGYGVKANIVSLISAVP